jgi:hypothetical protein
MQFFAALIVFPLQCPICTDEGCAQICFADLIAFHRFPINVIQHRTFQTAETEVKMILFHHNPRKFYEVRITLLSSASNFGPPGYPNPITLATLSNASPAASSLVERVLQIRIILYLHD